MTLSEILAANFDATPSLWVSASWLNDTMTLDLDRDDLRRVVCSCSDGIRQADKDQLGAIADRIIAATDLAKVEMEDDGPNLYYATLSEEEVAEGLTVSVTLAVTDLDPDPDELNGWCAGLIANGDALADDARAWLDGTASDGGPELQRLVADWRANH